MTRTGTPASYWSHDCPASSWSRVSSLMPLSCALCGTGFEEWLAHREYVRKMLRKMREATGRQNAPEAVPGEPAPGIGLRNLLGLHDAQGRSLSRPDGVVYTGHETKAQGRARTLTDAIALRGAATRFAQAASTGAPGLRDQWQDEVAPVYSAIALRFAADRLEGRLAPESGSQGTGTPSTPVSGH